ncbi:MAG TPA: TolC family protein [Polyangiaceae bacterium]|nr:TolC family protein [Polyangiaceae bacterium]
MGCWLSTLAGLAGCVAHSTAPDYGAVQSLVRERTQLELEPRSSPSPGNVDPAARTLLAEPLSVDNAVRIALLNNRDLRADLLGLGVARGQLVQASLFPNLDFEAQVRFSQDPGPGPQWDFGAGIDITKIILNGKRRGVAEAELEAARFRAAGATLDLGYRVRLAYYQVQELTGQLELRKTAEQVLAAGSEAAQALHDAGNLTELDRSVEQAAAESAHLAVAEAEADLVEGREQLNVLLGLYAGDTAWSVEPHLPHPAAHLGDLARIESRAIQASVELAEMRATLNAAARRAGLTEASGWLPELNVEVHAEHDGAYWELGPALTGKLPLFDRQQGDVLSQQAELSALRERYVAQAVAIRAAIRAARARALSALARAERYRNVLLPLRERVVKQTLLEYNAMQVGVFQLLQARHDQIDTGSAYVSVLLEYWQARARLEQLLAGRMAVE